MKIWEFVLAATLAEVTPGPNMGYLAALALAQGRRAGFAAVAGVSLGLSMLGVASAFGAGLLMQNIPAAGPVLRWAGVAYLFWLAYDAWRGASGDETDEIAPSFRRGLIVNLLNPKAAVFYIVVLPLFAGETPPGTVALLWLTAIYVVIATAIHAGVVLGASALRNTLASERRLMLIQRSAAVMLGLVALWFAWETGR